MNGTEDGPKVRESKYEVPVLIIPMVLCVVPTLWDSSDPLADLQKPLPFQDTIPRSFLARSNSGYEEMCSRTGLLLHRPLAAEVPT